MDLVLMLDIEDAMHQVEQAVDAVLGAAGTAVAH